MKKIELRIVALSHSVSQSNNYAVVLGEMVGLRRIPIVIGSFEAQAIAVAMEKMTPNRPLTHDLFKQTLEAFKVEIKEIIINNLLDGIFYAIGFLNDECMVYHRGWMKIQNSLEFLLEGNSDHE